MKDSKLRLLSLLIVPFLRAFFAFEMAYLHPDEHLQGPQPIAHGLFNWAAQQPWEFNQNLPVRSFVPLWLLYGTPMRFFTSTSDPKHVIYTMRVFFAVISWFLIDAGVERLCRSRNDKLKSLFFVSTSYVTLTWQSHTFSNCFETLLVLWFLVILYEADSLTLRTLMSPLDVVYDSALLGIIISLGVFNRPTFLAFILLPSLQLPKIWLRSYISFVVFSVSLVVTASICIYTDTWLYNSETWVFTPLNFVKYNMQSANLNVHGLDSRFKHLFTSLPTLLGPGLALLTPNWTSLPVQSIVSALFILSLIPHQEPRFLLPLVPLFCTQMTASQFKTKKVRRWMLSLWITFNLVAGVLIGVFHQAGIVPAQIEVSKQQLPLTVVWWRTYNPPLWVTGLPSSRVRYAVLSELYNSRQEVLELAKSTSTELGSSQPILTEIDLQGADSITLHDVLDACSNQTLVVFPNTAKPDFFNLFKPGHEPTLAWHTFKHLDFDHLTSSSGVWSNPFGLSIWNMTAAELL